MKELSIFIDESGDFGKYSPHSPYYIITMVFHNQSADITPAITTLNHELQLLGLTAHCIHTGPIIRQEEDYSYMYIKERRRIFNKMIAFIRQIDIQYKSFFIEKKHIANIIEATEKLTKIISFFIYQHYQIFLSFDSIKVYYDNGQTEVNKILLSVFQTQLTNVEFRKVIPSHYKLFQVADLLCTFELLRLKITHNALSKSELRFFGSIRDLNKNYLKPLADKELR